MRKALYSTLVLAGVSPLFAGCASQTTSAPKTAAKSTTFSDLPGVSTVAGWFKKDPKTATAPDANIYKDDPIAIGYKNRKAPGPEVYATYGKVQERAGNLDAAEKQYQQALKLAPKDADSLIAYAHLKDRQGKLDEATDLYKQAIKHHPENATAHNDLGLCYARQKKMDASIASLSRAVQLQPAKKLYRNNIATVLVQLDRMPEALEHLSYEEKPAVANYNLACLLHQSGKTQAAGHYFASAAQMDPELTAAREWAVKLGSMPPPAGPRLTNVRANPSDVDPNDGSFSAYNTPTADSTSLPVQYTSSAATGHAYQQHPVGVHQSYQTSDSPYHPALPPTPSNADAYSAENVGNFPPVDGNTPLPRF